jgi:hypothetical protein
MTRNGSHAHEDTGSQAELQPEAQRSSASASGSRRPYHAPRLRHLGSVRELTLGATMGMPEGGGSLRTGGGGGMM